MDIKNPTDTYKAFFSYSHAADGDLAAFLQSALQGFAKAWYRRRAIRVFRDTTGLAVTPDLWTAIREALHASEYFILFASEQAAQSHWVELELNEWLSIRTPDRMLIVWTDGELAWDSTANDFDWKRSTAVHPRLRGVFHAEPLYVDLRWANSSADLSMRRPEFLDAVGRLSATLRQIPVDDLLGEDVRQHRRTRRLAGAAVGTLAVLAIAAVTAATFAVQQRDEARGRLVELLVANGAREMANGDLSASALWFAEALRLEPGRSSARELQRIRVSSAIAAHPAIARVWSADSAVVARLVAFGRDARYVISEGVKGETDPATHEDLTLHADAPSVWNAVTGDPIAFRVPAGQRVLDVDAAADRVRLIVANREGGVRLLDATSGTDMVRFDDPAEVLSADFSEDGRAVLTVSGDNTVRLWDASNGQMLAALPHESAVGAAGLTADGNRVLSMTDEGTAHIWTLDARHRVVSHRTIPHKDAVAQIDVTRDGRYSVTVADRDARLWDIASPEAIHLKSWSGVNHAEFSPDGKLLLLADDFGEASVFALDPLTELAVARPAGAVLHATFSADSRRFATASTDRVARVWDAHTGEPLSPPLYHEANVTHVAFDAGQTHLATATAGIVRLWELPRLPPALKHESVRDIAFHPDGRHLLSVNDLQAKLWDLQGAGAPVTVSPGPQIFFATLSPDGHRIATAGADGTARIWDSATGAEILSLVHQTRVHHAAFRADGAWLATAGAGGGSESEVVVWDIAKNTRVFTLPLGSDWAKSVEFSSDGKRLLALTSSDVRVLDLASKREIDGLHINDATTAAFSPDGTLLVAVIGADVKVYDVARPAMISRIRHDDYRIDHVAFTADSKKLVVVGGGYARLWDARSGAPLTPPLRHDARTNVTTASVSADGRFLATASQDGSARIWYAATGQPVTPPLIHGKELRTIAFSPDSSRLATAGGNAVRVWNIADGVTMPDDGLALSAQTLAARRIDATGAIVPMSSAEFVEAWHRMPRY